MPEQRDVTEQEVAQAILNKIDRFLNSMVEPAHLGPAVEGLANAYAKLVHVPHDHYRSVDLRSKKAQ